MRTQVGHYLDRARIAARANVIGAVTEVKPVVASLVRAMNRIHEDRGLALSSTVPDDALFKGEKQDLEEIVGNLVDNACKWAKTEVAISAEYRRPVDDEATGRLILRIDDDGPGLTAEEQKEATRRGRRLDEIKARIGPRPVHRHRPRRPLRRQVAPRPRPDRWRQGRNRAPGRMNRKDGRDARPTADCERENRASELQSRIRAGLRFADRTEFSHLAESSAFLNSAIVAWMVELQPGASARVGSEARGKWRDWER